MKSEIPASLIEQISHLSPEKRALLELKLKEKLQRAGSKKITVRNEQSVASPLSFAQQRFWFLDQLEPDIPVYNEWTAVRLAGLLDIAVLAQSINEIVRRNEALRTTFALHDGQPVQMIAPFLTLPLPVIDLRQITETEREDEAARLINVETERLFDLEHGPLLRVRLFQLAEQEHILLVTFHHILIDAWSTTILYRELGILYAAFLQKQPSPLPQLPVQYSDFSLWQREWLQSGTFAAQLTYWQKQLADLSPLHLPTDYPRPHKQTFPGAQQSIPISAALAKALNILSQQEKVSLFTTLLAAFQTLLHRYSGQDNIVVGSPIAGRNRPEIEGLIGCFTNTLVLREDFSGNPTFRTFLGRVRTTVLDALAHQEMPFEKLVEELQPERDLSRTPLFQVMLVFNNTALDFNQFGAVQATPVDVESTVAKFDLTLDVTEFETGLKAHLEYNTDLFDPATIERMAGHLQVLLAGIVADPDQHISDLPLLTEAERHQMLVEWNATQIDRPKEKCIHQLFEEQVERTPDAVAVVFEEQRLTYQELNAWANQLAHHLRSLNVGPETLVGICVEPSLEMVVGLLGVLKAGGAYIPLDPNYPQGRLVYMLQDSQAAVLLTQAKFVSQFADNAVQTVCFDSAWPVIAEPYTENPVYHVKPNHLAYVIYTSGSTGEPKGVMVEHQALAGHITNINTIYEITVQDSVLQFAAFSFDAAQEQIFTTLCSGAALVLRGNELWTVEEFNHHVTTHGITVVDLPPIYFQQLLTTWLKERPVFFDNQLRLILVGGEKIQPETVKLWRQLSAPCRRMLNVYGPTETTITATLFDLTSYQPKTMPANLPIGQPLPGRKAYILDNHRQPLPVGIFGELYIGGDSLARGYLNRPELTEEKFIPNPFVPKSDTAVQLGLDRLYSTGDLARYLPDGNIEFLGRIDSQVKLRGFRIELGEIETLLCQHPAVQEAVVVTHEDVPGDKRLVAYIKTDGTLHGTATTTLRGQLRQKLPNYMIPSTFVLLDTLPLTPNGKVDRRALPAPMALQHPLSDTFVLPSTPAEESVAAIWCEVLRLAQVGIHDDFFEIGGHSLLATQVISRCREAFLVQVPLRNLFEEPTVAGLAARIEQLKLTQELQQTAETVTEMGEEIREEVREEIAL